MAQAVDAELLQVPRQVGLDLGRQRVARVAFGALGKRNCEVAHLGNSLGVDERLRDLREETGHLDRGLEVELLAAEPHPVGVLELRARLNAQERVVRPGVLGPDVVDVIRADHAQIELLRELQEVGNDLPLKREPVILDFDEEILAPVDVDEPGRRAAGVIVASLEQPLRDERGQAARKGNQTARVLRQGLEIGPRAVIEAAQMGIRNELEQVVVARLVAREQAHVEDRLALLASARALKTGSFSQVYLAADQRLQAVRLRLEVEVDRAEEVAVVGEGQRLHAETRGAVHQPVDPAGAVQQAVVAVDMEVDEIGVG